MKSTRKGIAPLEVAIILPVVVVLMLTLFWITSVGVTRVEATLEARHQAHQPRHQRKGNLAMASRVYVPGGRNLKELLPLKDKRYVRTKAHVIRRVNPVFSFFEAWTLEANVGSKTLAETLDFRTMRQSNHKELTFPREYRSVGLSVQELSEFKKEFDSLHGEGNGNDGAFSKTLVDVQQDSTIANLKKALQHVEGEQSELEPDDYEKRAELDRKRAAIEETLNRVIESKL